MNNVKNLIEESLTDLAVSKSALARELGIQQQQLNNILNGDAKMPVKYFHKLCNFLLIDKETLKQEFIQDYTEELENKIGSK